MAAILVPNGWAEEVWDTSVSGSWSSGLRWLDDTAPPVGGDAALILRFAGDLTSAYTTTNDLGAPFALNKLIFDSNSAVTVASAAGNRIELGGADPTLVQDGFGNAAITSALTLHATSGNAAIDGSNIGALTVTGNIDEIAGPQTLVIAADPISADVQRITLAGVNTFSGGVRLDSGNLALSGSGALGTGQLVVNGGTLRLLGGTIANGIVLNHDLLIQSPGGTTLSSIISSGVPGAGLTLRNSGTTLTLTNANTYSGATTLNYSLTPNFAAGGAGTLILSGNGSALNSSAFNVHSGATLQISAASGGATDRVGDATPVNLRGGQLTFVATNGAVATENIGPLSGAGYSTVTVSAISANTRLTAASLGRTERGTFLLRGSALGGAGGNLLFTTAPPGLVGSGAGSILPYAIGDTAATGTGSTFVNYSAATGIRPLAIAEYGTALSTATSTTNVRLTASTFESGPKTINSLIVVGNTAGSFTTVDGGALTLASGALLATSGNSTITNPLSFGAVEASIFSLGSLTLRGDISGSNGLTKSGAGSLQLDRASNTFSGPLTINAGIISFFNAGALGNADSTIVLNGTGAGLTGGGTLTRDLFVGAGIGRLDGNLTMSGHIGGPGGMQFLGSSSTARIALASGNTYQGTTVIGSGTLVIPDDTALGTGSAMELSGGATLQLAGPWSTVREFSMGSGTGSAAIDTAGFAASINGPMIGTVPMIKRGAGSLTITQHGTFSGALTVEKGEVSLAGNGSLASTSIALSPGTRLELDYSASTRSGRVPTSAAIVVNGGELRILGSSTSSIRQVLGSFGFSGTDPASTLTLTAPGGGSTILTAGTLNSAGTLGLVRGTNLGGGPGGVFSRAVFSNLTPATATAALAGLLVDTSPVGSGSSFATYDFSSDAAGPIGLRPLLASEYASGPVIQNPANGGTTPTDAYFLASGAVTAIGARNELGSLTLEPGAGVALLNGQTLRVSGGLLTRGGADALIAGGTLEFLTESARIHTVSDATISAELNALLLMRKTGPGTLTLAGPARFAGSGLTVIEGAVRPGAMNSFAPTVVALNATGTLDLGPLSAAVGGLSGNGTVVLRDRTLTLGTSFLATNFSGNIEGTGSLEIVDGGLPFALRTLSGTGTFSGGVTLTSGRLAPSGTALGTGVITAQGGALQPGVGYILNNPLTITGNLAITGSNGMTIPAATALMGPGDLVLSGTGTVTIQTAAGLTGSLRTDSQVPGDRPVGSRIFVLSGPSGSLRDLSQVRLESGGTLRLDDSADPPDAGNRLSPATPILLRGGTLALTGGNTSPAAESVGPLIIEGQSFITVTPGTPGASLTIPTITRADRAVLNVRGEGLGGMGATQSRIFVSTPPELVGGGGSGLETSIIPWAVGYNTQAGATATFVTYSTATGLRPLDPTTEMPLTTFSGPVSPTGNYRAGTAVTVNSPVQVNALALTGGQISGTGTIRLGSGSLLDPVGTIVLNPIDFGAVEGRLLTPNSSPSIPTILSGPISGTGGLTKAGSGILTLAADNPFTGGLTVESGTLRFSSPANLGADTTAIRLYGAALQYTGTSPLTLTRDLEIRGASIYGPSASPLTISGSISGSGGLSVPTGGALQLTGSNTYTGPTFIDGKLSISSDSSLGNGGHVVLGSNLTLLGDWTTSRVIELRATSFIETGEFDAVWNGPFIRSNPANLFKTGSGSITLTAASLFDGELNLNAGTMRLAGAGRFPTPSVIISNAAAFISDNTSFADTDRIPDTATFQLFGGELQIIGNATSTVRERIGAISLGSSSLGRVILHAPGAEPVIASFSGLTLNSGRFTARGNDLGGLTRVIFRTPPGLINGINPSIVADRGDGLGVAFATYDSTVDSEGPIGLRPLFATEYATDFTQPGGATLHFRVSGPIVTLPSNLTSASVNSLTIAPGTRFTMTAAQSLLVGSTGILAQAGAPSRIEGGTLAFGSNRVNLLGDGDLTITSNFSGTGGFTKSGAGTVHLNGPTSWNGTFDIIEGTLRVSPPSAFQIATLNLGAGGTFAVQDVPTDVGGISGAGTVALGAGRLRVLGSSASTFQGDVRGSGDLQVFGNLNLTGANTFTGLAFVGRDPASLIATTSTLSFTSNGTAFSTRGLVTRNGGLLRIDASTASQPLNRFGPVPVTISGGSLSLIGNSGAAATQTLGPLTASGRSTITVQPNAGSSQPLALVFSDFTRIDHGTLRVSLADRTTSSLILGSNLLSALVGNGTGATDTPVLPFAVETGIAGTPRLTTYDAITGLRPIDPATQMAASLVAGQNVNLTSNTTVASDITVNSLRTAGLLTGTGRLTVSSGVVMAISGSISVPLNFGAAEGFIFINDGTTIDRPISGSGGLTISTVGDEFSNLFHGQVFLSAANTFTGPLTLNSTRVSFSEASNLGVGLAPIILHNGVLDIHAAPQFVLNKPLQTEGWQAVINNSSALTLAQPISGSGGIYFGDDVTLLAPSSYEGATQITGKLTISQANAFVNSSLLAFNSGGTSTIPRLRLLGNWTNDSLVSGAARIDTNGFAAQLAGGFSPGTSLVKEGNGTLSIVDPKGLGAVTVEGGTLDLEGTPGASGPSSILVNPPGALKGEATITGDATIRGLLSPGDALGTIAVGGILALNPGARLAFEIGGPTPGLYDQVRAVAAITLSSNVTLSVSLANYAPSEDEVFYLLTRDNSASFAVSFDGLPEGSTINLGGPWTGTVTYQADWNGSQLESTVTGGNDIAIFHVVPEPSVGSALLTGALLLCLRRRVRDTA